MAPVENHPGSRRRAAHAHTLPPTREDEKHEHEHTTFPFTKPPSHSRTPGIRSESSGKVPCHGNGALIALSKHEEDRRRVEYQGPRRCMRVYCPLFPRCCTHTGVPSFSQRTPECWPSRRTIESAFAPGTYTVPSLYDG